MTGPGLNIASFAGIAPLFPEIYVSATPFMFKDAAAAHAFFDSGSYWQAAREAFRERTGTELLAVVEEGGFLNFTNGKKPIHGPADFQEMCIRDSPQGHEDERPDTLEHFQDIEAADGRHDEQAGAHWRGDQGLSLIQIRCV